MRRVKGYPTCTVCARGRACAHLKPEEKRKQGHEWREGRSISDMTRSTMSTAEETTHGAAQKEQDFKDISLKKKEARHDRSRLTTKHDASRGNQRKGVTNVPAGQLVQEPTPSPCTTVRIGQGGLEENRVR